MKPLLLLGIATAYSLLSIGQNVGINNNQPGFPLTFSEEYGNKISLTGNSSDHYGFGIQSGLLQIHSDGPTADIAFGFGSSENFTERMRIINSGSEGLDLKGRVTLRNGTSPVDFNYGTGIWMYKADNSSMLGFMGVQNNQNLGFYGGVAGWGFVYDAINSRVGIGNANPKVPLAFSATLGKKISLYPGATGDVGFGVAGNRLQIFSDNPNADVAIGYDAAGVFNERFAVKPNGALAINGSTGTTGQVLQSNGAAAPVWASIKNNLYDITTNIEGTGSISATSNFIDIPGLTYTFTATGNVKVLVYFNVAVYASTCSACSTSNVYIGVKLDNNAPQNHNYPLGNDELLTSSGSALLQVGSGTHTIKLVGLAAQSSGSRSITLGTVPGVYMNNMIVQVISQ